MRRRFAALGAGRIRAITSRARVGVTRDRPVARGDRGRELTKAIMLPDFDGFDRGRQLQDLYYVTLTQYEEGLPVHGAERDSGARSSESPPGSSSPGRRPTTSRPRPSLRRRLGRRHSRAASCQAGSPLTRTRVSGDMCGEVQPRLAAPSELGESTPGARIERGDGRFCSASL